MDIHKDWGVSSFYCPSINTIIKTGNAKFIEDVESSGSEQPRNIVFEEESVDIPLINTKSDEVVTPVVVQDADYQFLSYLLLI